MASPFTPEEHQRIDSAVAAVERDTSADFCVVVVRASDRYSLYPLAYAALIAIFSAAVVSLAVPQIGSRVVILIELAVTIVLTLTLDWLPIRLVLVPQRIKHAHAWQLAHREFNAQTNAKPDQKHRVLLFVSIGERYVEIIADHETHALTDEGTWKTIVDEFLGGVKAGLLANSVVRAVGACGAILKTHHPAPNERRA
jgi:putative membrane protein